MILLCLASSTTPPRRNLLVALVQYTATHFRSSCWFLSFPIKGKRAWRASRRVPFIEMAVLSKASDKVKTPTLQLRFSNEADANSCVLEINRTSRSGG